MAKKKKNKEVDELDNVEGRESEKAGNKIVSFLIALVIVIIWLAVFALLIKLDVGGFGSKVLTPVLKDVPIINGILPNTQSTDEEGNTYRTLDEALTRIKELELELDSMGSSGSANSEYISELESENARLKEFEDKQKEFEERVAEFERNVVFNEKAPDIEEYKAYYESIDPENAEKIYKQVVEQIEADKSLVEAGERYAKMEPANAAEILEVMTGDLDLVCGILKNMKTEESAAIIAEMTPEYAAKVTKKMSLMAQEEAKKTLENQ